jgi:CRP/FNR family transcriptional regulator, anaerobic regulatory protein
MSTRSALPFGNRSACALGIPCRACICELRLVETSRKRGRISVAPGTDLIAQGQKTRNIYTLYEGWAARYRTLSDGRRQILDILLPGDMIGLPAALLGGAGHSVCALTAATFCVLDVNRLTALLRRQPRLALNMLRTRLREQERADAWLTVLGHMGASERIGYLLLLLRDRLDERGFAKGRSWSLPLLRAELADTVGLSKVHVMRALRALRDQGLANLDAHRVFIPDSRNLARFAGYSRIRSTSGRPSTDR